MSGAAFGYARAVDIDDAVAVGARAGVTFLGGGTDLLQLWKIDRAAPRQVLDITRLPLADIHLRDGRLTIGATARLHAAGDHPAIVDHHPLVAAAIAASASGQVRNMATVGGNLLQRTRCPYLRTEGARCNKHLPGSGCGARDGEHRHAAIFGASEACIATHPSDLAVALSALDADVHVVGASGSRRFGLDQLHRLPGDEPERDTNLAHGELITAVTISDGARFAAHSAYLKVRDRASFEFMVVAVAAAMRIEGGVVAEARLAAGGVAAMPWRLAASERSLVGRRAEPSAFDEAARLAIEQARPLPANRFKVGLLERAVVRALETARGDG